MLQHKEDILESLEQAKYKVVENLMEYGHLSRPRANILSSEVFQILDSVNTQISGEVPDVKTGSLFDESIS
jgi:hypothetical protein